MVSRKRAPTRLPLLALLAGHLLASAAQADDAAHGAELAHALCAECHLNPGQGEKRGPMGVPSFDAVANRPLQTPDRVVGWLKSAPPMMPNHKLTQDEIYDLAAFIMTLRKDR